MPGSLPLSSLAARSAYSVAFFQSVRATPLLFAKRNESWAVALDATHPLDRRPNTWVIRYGDQEWKQFLDFWCTYLVVNGEIERLFKYHMEKLGAA
jgi:hypothetical protein